MGNLGLLIDTVPMTIAVSHSRMLQWPIVLPQWPVIPRVATVIRIHSLLKRELLHFSEVVPSGNFFVRRRTHQRICVG